MTSEQAGQRGRLIRKILLPLDGSAFAERAAPVAQQLAAALNADLLIARIIPTLVWAYAAAGGPTSAEVYDQLLRDEEGEVEKYLSRMVASGEALGIRTFTIAARGEVASALLDIITDEQVDLVVMTTHGRTGAPRFAMGSVADRVLRGGSAATLLLRSFTDSSAGDATAQSPILLSRAVVTVDGSRLAESAFDMVEALAGPIITSVTLMRVLPLEAGAGQTQDARTYLYDAAQRLRERIGAFGAEVTTQLEYGPVAERIVEDAEQQRDLIVMATHGATGARRWAYGSVTDRVLHGARTPLLVTRMASEKRP
jgi:nucleotide-binding universal stress UspA family protein